ncbi:hypothetical protein TcWFU_003377 [Taenia crassiceps]|uniref:Uncharacterized protein n=1 Tax=Taenia crassiceps TaxID=6207 RepID=A0ABR4Q3J0_9CEST
MHHIKASDSDSDCASEDKQTQVFPFHLCLGGLADSSHNGSKGTGVKLLTHRMFVLSSSLFLSPSTGMKCPVMGLEVEATLVGFKIPLHSRRNSKVPIETTQSSSIFYFAV